MRDLNQALSLKADFPGALNSRGNVYADLKETDRAIADYNEAIRLDPNHKLAYYNRGNAYGDKGDTARRSRTTTSISNWIRATPTDSTTAGTPI